jgi:hypothetical protein
MFVIVDLQTVFHTEIINMFMIHLHTKFHMPNGNGSLVNAVGPEAWLPFCTFTIYRKISLTIVPNFSKLYYHTALMVSKLSGSSVALIISVALEWPLMA